MALDLDTVPSVGDATKVSDYVRLRDVCASLRGGDAHDFGGSLDTFVEDEDWVDLPDSCELEIDGTHDAGRSVYVEVNIRARMKTGGTWSGSVTGSVRLFNVTTEAAIASSQVDVTLEDETRVRSLSSTITLTTGINPYTIQIKTSDDARPVAARVRVVKR